MKSKTATELLREKLIGLSFKNSVSGQFDKNEFEREAKKVKETFEENDKDPQCC